MNRTRRLVRPLRSRTVKMGLAAVAAALTMAGVIVVAVALPAQAAVGCQVTYTASPWTTSPGQGGFTAQLIIRNLGDPITSWTLRFTFPAGQTFTPSGWGATWSQSGAVMTGTSLSWDGNLGTNQATGAGQVGFNGTWTGSNPNPTDFSLNGVACTGSTTPTPTSGNTPPTVSLTSPANGATFNPPATVNFAATASDPGGSVARVEFLNGTTVVGTDTTSPYSFAWTNVGAGTYTLAARAVDNQGASTTTPTITITVSFNSPPMLSNLSPPPGSTFTAPANITMSVTATDPDGVARVDFTLGSMTGSDTTAPYSFTFTNVAAGTYAESVRATDNVGTVGVLDPVVITVNPPNNTPPQVTLTSPLSGATFTAPATVNFAATASDPGGSVARVEFLNGTTVVGTDTTSPYSFSWTNVAAGSYSVAARAVDNQNASTTTPAVSITVNGTTTGPAPALHVEGNRLVTAAGTTYRLLGVNRAGGEYACIQGNGMWDGPMDQSVLNAMRTWKIRVLRIPLNESCWLGNSVLTANGDTADIPAGGVQGAQYQQNVVNLVNLAVASGITPIVEMHWSWGIYQGNSAGSCPNRAIPAAACQKPMPDAKYAPMFWTSVANTFRGNNAVILDLFNEPFPERATGSTTTGWQCWRNGSSSPGAAPCTGIPYQVAGFQSLVNAVRATGATNVIQIGGLAFSNDATQWLQNRPTDSTGNLMAFAHVYNFNSCSSTSCFESQMAPVAAQVPFALTEIGENDCAHGFIDTVMSWADSRAVGYLGWTWNPNFDCFQGPGLISNINGTPTNFGVGLRDHLLVVSN